VALGEAIRSERELAQEFRIHREDTRELRWLGYQDRVVVRQALDEAVVLTGLAFDVTERRFAQETRELLNRELSHRLKNLLSIVGSLVVMTGEQQPEARNFVKSLQARLNNLAAAHDLLVQSDWQPVALAHLIEALAPLGVYDRIDLNSNELVLGSYDAQTVVLVVHELATNAIKYGALSSTSGRIALDFEMREAFGGADAATLLIAWKERGGPQVVPPLTKGFGVNLLERLARRQQAGEPVLDWRREGLCCKVTLRISPPRRELA
jgi:two-component sensor histidine kinase